MLKKLTGRFRGSVNNEYIIENERHVSDFGNGHEFRAEENRTSRRDGGYERSSLTLYLSWLQFSGLCS